MTDEKKLIRQFNQGSRDALCEIYQRYKKDLFGLAISLLRDRQAAEDAVHDVIVSFARQAGHYKLKGTLKNYLLTAVANRARDYWRRPSVKDVPLERVSSVPQTDLSGEQYAILTEEFKRLQNMLSQIPYEQREIVLLHLHYDMTFREIASAQGVSINTVQSRYRYGMEKLHQLLKEGCEHERFQTNRRLDSSH